MRVLAVCLFGSAVSQVSQPVHWEFDESFLMPPGASAAFSASCGVLHQALGQNGGYTLGGSMDPQLPIVIEARLVAYVGQAAGQDRRIGMMGCFPNGANRANCQVVFDVIDGSVFLSGQSVATLPAGTAFMWHTYRLTVLPGPASSWDMTLEVDGAPVVGPTGAPFYNNTFVVPGNSWLIGSIGTGGSSLPSATGDWDYVSVSQAPGGQGQANSYEAALFIQRAALSVSGAIGHRGPFVVGIVGGQDMKIEWNGPPGAPFALFFGDQNSLGSTFLCAGRVDIGSGVGLNGIGLLFGAFGPLGWLYTLDGCGYSRQVLRIPPGIPQGVNLANLQGAILQGQSCPLVLTAAFYVNS